MLLGTYLLAFWFWQADPQAEGLKALENQKYAEAVEQFQKAVALAPKDYGAHFHLALSFSLLNKDREAIAEYKSVLELQPGLYEAELNLGILLLRQKQPAAAVPYLQAAVEKKPKEFRPRSYLGEAHFATDDPAAEADFRAALEIDPKSAVALSGLGRTLAKQGKLSEAAGLYQQAADLDPDFQDLLLELAEFYERAKQPDQAIAIYQKFPQLPGVGERMGALLMESGRNDEAIPLLEAAVKAAPGAANQFALASAYIRTKQNDKAIPLLIAAANASPGNLNLLMTLGRLLRDTKRYPNAAQIFLRATQVDAKSKEAWSELGGVLYLMENYLQAVAAFDKLIELGDATTGVYYFRAITLDRMHEYKLAQPAYEKFLSLSQNKNLDEEFKARQRLIVIRKELAKH